MKILIRWVGSIFARPSAVELMAVVSGIHDRMIVFNNYQSFGAKTWKAAFRKLGARNSDVAESAVRQLLAKTQYQPDFVLILKSVWKDTVYMGGNKFVIFQEHFNKSVSMSLTESTDAFLTYEGDALRISFERPQMAKAFVETFSQRLAATAS